MDENNEENKLEEIESANTEIDVKEENTEISNESNGKKNKKEKKKSSLADKIISTIILVVCICGLIYSGSLLYKWVLNNIKSNGLINEVEDIAGVKDIGDDEDPGIQFGLNFEKLLAYNPDVVGWIKIPRTSISYSILQGESNNTYLRHSIDGSWNEFGWIFMESKNAPDFSDENTVIYGHHIVSGLMFADVENIYNGSLGNDVDINIYRKDYRLLKYKVFSTYVCDVESYYLTTSFSSEESYSKFLDTMLDRSVINFGQTVSPEDKIITLSTCTTDAKRRIVVHAKLVSNTEMPR